MVMVMVVAVVVVGVRRRLLLLWWLGGAVGLGWVLARLHYVGAEVRGVLVQVRHQHLGTAETG